MIDLLEYAAKNKCVITIEPVQNNGRDAWRLSIGCKSGKISGVTDHNADGNQNLKRISASPRKQNECESRQHAKQHYYCQNNRICTHVYPIAK